MSAKNYSSREEIMLEYPDLGHIKTVHRGEVVNVVDDKGALMIHPVIVLAQRGGLFYGFECTASQPASPSQGMIKIVDWEEANFDDYCEYHTAKCARVESYFIEDAAGSRGEISERDFESANKANRIYCLTYKDGRTLDELLRQNLCIPKKWVSPQK